MNPNIFREYDIRGLHETDLTSDVAQHIGKALGTELLRRGETSICVGCDVRPSSPRLKSNAIAGLVSTGINVHDVGTVPTPVVYFGAQHLDCGGSLQITGSHNPVEYNGFKMTHRASSIFGDQIQGLMGLIEAGDFETGEGTVESHDVLDGYVRDIKGRVSIARPLKIVIDAGNGCASEIAPKLFRDLGCEVVELYCEIDGTFPNHLPDPTVMKYVVDLVDAVERHDADLGIGYDGDADRIGVIDNTGRIVPGDRLLAMFSRDILTRQPGASIIFDVKCSQALAEDIEAHGGKPVMWKTGHSLIKTKMKEAGAPAAGEMSGHIFFTERFRGYDDAIYASARFVDIIAGGTESVAEIDATVPRYVSTPEIRVETSYEDKFRVVDELVAHFKNDTDHEVIDVDGVRVLFGDGWGLVRASNTQPVLVMRFEARSEDRLQEIAETVLTKVREYPSVDISDLVIEAL